MGLIAGFEAEENLQLLLTRSVAPKFCTSHATMICLLLMSRVPSDRYCTPSDCASACPCIYSAVHHGKVCHVQADCRKLASEAGSHSCVYGMTCPVERSWADIRKASMPDILQISRTSVFGMWSCHLTWAIRHMQRMWNCSSLRRVGDTGPTTRSRRVGKSRLIDGYFIDCPVGCHDRSKDA